LFSKGQIHARAVSENTQKFRGNFPNFPALWDLWEVWGFWDLKYWGFSYLALLWTSMHAPAWGAKWQKVERQRSNSGAPTFLELKLLQSEREALLPHSFSDHGSHCRHCHQHLRIVWYYNRMQEKRKGIIAPTSHNARCPPFCSLSQKTQG
jgi:hypothetical protein